MVVVDASIALFAAASSDGFALLDGLEPVAPPLLWSEATSALRAAAWRGDITEELAAIAFARLEDAPIERRQEDGLHREAWAVAKSLGWAKTYDAEYVALARILGCRLCTRDARLHRGAARAVEVIGPAGLRA